MPPFPVPAPAHARPRTVRSCTLRALATVGVWAALALAPAAAPCGDGTLADGHLNLTVYFTYPESDPASWEPVFEAYSELLLNATEGAIQLGTVTFTTSAALADRADVWVLDDMSGARGHFGGLGRLGQHITISQTHRSTSGAALGQFGLAHETGHYVWSLYDEYRGFIGTTPGTDPLHFCSSSFGITACLMDGGTTVAPNNLRTEFCTDAAFPWSTRHNAGVYNGGGELVRTDQQYVLGRSCWRHIALTGIGGLAHPAGEPLDVDYAGDPVEFDTSRYYGDLALGLVLDTSGSMSADRRLDGAIAGAEEALSLLRDGEQQLVVAFDDAPRLVVPLQTVAPGTRASALAAVGGLSAQGGTHAGDALCEALDQLQGVNAARTFLVLLTDGVSAPPVVNDDAIVTRFLAADVALYTIALGSFPEVDALSDAAVRTGGAFYAADSPEDLPGILAAIFAQAGGGTTLEQRVGAASAGRLDTSVELGADAVALVVSGAAALGAPPELTVRGPDGRSWSSDGAHDGAEVRDGAAVRVLRLAAPAPGLWSIEARPAAGSGTSLALHVAVEQPTLRLHTAARHDRVGPGEDMHVETSVVARAPVAGALVRGTVWRPDGTSLPVVLRDDGHPASGDEHAGDGVYSVLCSTDVGPGAYRFALEVWNERGTAASSRECGRYGASGGGDEEGAATEWIAPFRALTETTVVRTDGGGSGAPGRSALASHAVAPDAADGELFGFALATSLDEPQWLERLRLEPDAAARARLASAGALELTLDEDRDGRLDRPRRPLARARWDGADLVFERVDGDLALLAPGATRAFLVVAVAAPAPRTAGGAGSGVVRGVQGRGGVAGPGGWEVGWAGVWLALVGLAWLAVGRAARAGKLAPLGVHDRPQVLSRQGVAAKGLTKGHGSLQLLTPQGFARDRAHRRGPVLLACAALAALACGTRSSPGPTVTLDPADLSLRGALTSAPLPVDGPVLTLALTPP